MLGIIPGTNIQISFHDWTIAVLGTVALLLIISVVRNHRLISRLLWASLRLPFRATKQTALQA
jgi:hypothetical protein